MCSGTAVAGWLRHDAKSRTRSVRCSMRRPRATRQESSMAWSRAATPPAATRLRTSSRGGMSGVLLPEVGAPPRWRRASTPRSSSAGRTDRGVRQAGSGSCLRTAGRSAAGTRRPTAVCCRLCRSATRTRQRGRRGCAWWAPRCGGTEVRVLAQLSLRVMTTPGHYTGPPPIGGGPGYRLGLAVAARCQAASPWTAARSRVVSGCWRPPPLRGVAMSSRCGRFGWCRRRRVRR